jgi:PIN domain nuclease of toxin-antitoxin system
MRVLLDTHALLWWIQDDDRLSAAARTAISSAGNRVFVSAASMWEIVTKAKLGRLRLHEPIHHFVSTQFEANEFEALPITVRHTFELEKLPDLHRDPFDRMLIAQAIAEDMPLVSGDRAVQVYPVGTIW